DVKPGNLMVTAAGRVKLMDFGIARTQEESESLRTATRQALGTPAYMSPEQLRASEMASQVGPASDVYSLCATFYELFTETRLFRHDEDDAATVVLHKLQGDVRAPPSQLVPGLPWEIATILEGGLQPDPADRIASAGDLADDLRRF